MRKYRRSKASFFITLATAIVLVLVAVVGCYLILFYRKTSSAISPTQTSAPVRYTYFSKLNGGGVLNPEDETPAVVGIMVGNHNDARPQTGLDRAAVVYEAQVEGGITRYFAIFDNARAAEKVGPVRSARPYFLDWLAEYGNGLYMHVGGSPEALRLIKDRGLFDRNEFYWGRFYWRSNDRYAPHNVYTRSELWQALWGDNVSRRASWEGWKFSADMTATNTEPVSEITVNYGQGYQVGWKYNATTKKYDRLVGGAPHIMSDNVSVSADNVVIQYATMRIIDDYGRRSITTVGSGEARVLRSGVMVRGTWRKEALGSRTRFYDADGAEIPFAPGTTWVQVAPNRSAVEIKS